MSINLKTTIPKDNITVFITEIENHDSYIRAILNSIIYIQEKEEGK